MDDLPECSLFEWLSGLAADSTCEQEHLSARVLRLCLRDERDQARRFIARHGDALRHLDNNHKRP
jgi:hypothetical protein